MEAMNSPNTVYLHVTRACNLRCVYCYFSAGEPMGDELSTDEMLSLLEDVHLLGPRKVVFTGGEPLLRSDIFKLAQSLKDAGNNIHLCLITNGTLVDEVNAGSLVESFDEIRISIDCFKEVNDSVRGEGSFERVMKSFDCVLEAGGDPMASITATSLNLPHLKDFMKFLLLNGVSKIHVSPLKPAGRARDEQMLCDPEDIRRTVEDFWYESFGLRLKSDGEESFNCGVGKFLTVYPDGSVYPCHVLAFPEFCIGNVRERRLLSIYRESGLMNELRSLNFGEISQCSECFEQLSRETCLGVLAQEEGFRERLVDLFGV